MEESATYQVEGLVGVLESQEHVLEDRQGGPSNNGVQQLREDLEKSSCQGSPDPGCYPKPSVATADPVEWKQQADNARTQTDVPQSWMEQCMVKQVARVGRAMGGQTCPGMSCRGNGAMI